MNTPRNMTNKEDIEQLKWAMGRISKTPYSPETFEALSLAIEVLEEVDILRKAYDLACEELGDCLCWDKCGEEIDCSDKYCNECWKADFIQKARMNNDI